MNKRHKFMIIAGALGTIGGVVAFIILFLIHGSYKGQARFEIETATRQIAELRNEKIDLLYYYEFYQEYAARIAEIRTKGYTPDSLLIFGMQRELEKYPSLHWAELDTILRKESSYGFNKNKGVFGEKMQIQVDPETLKFYVFLAGGDVSPGKYNPDDYHNIKSSWEWYVIIAICIKARNGSVDYRYWYNGIFTKLNVLNKTRWEKYLEEHRDEIMPDGGVGGN